MLLTSAGAVQTGFLLAMAVMVGVLALRALVRVLRRRPADDENEAT